MELTPSQAFDYICVARKAQQNPQLQQALRQQKITVAKARRISSVINSINAKEWIRTASSSTKRELELILQGRKKIAQFDHIRKVTDCQYRFQAGLGAKTLGLFQQTQKQLSQNEKKVGFDEILQTCLQSFLEK